MCRNRHLVLYYVSTKNLLYCLLHCNIYYLLASHAGKAGIGLTASVCLSVCVFGCVCLRAKAEKLLIRN